VSSGWLATREDVKRGLDQAETARNNLQVDRALESATRNVEGLLHRKFFPVLATKYFDWPSLQYSYPWRIWFGDWALDLAAIPTSVTSGGKTIPLSACNFEPANSGPPFTYLELKRDQSYAFGGSSTPQRDTAITGLWAYGADTAPAGTLTAAVNSATATTIQVSDSSQTGVGNSLLIDTERMNVTGKTMVTTGQTLQTPLSASAANDQVAVTNGSAYAIDETLTLDTERMLVLDIIGNNLTVKRAYDGSVLAAHNGSTIYAPRQLVVERGVLGTTAATHLNAAPILRHQIPGLVKDLALALAINQVLQEGAGYARVQGSGDHQKEFTGRGIGQIQEDCIQAFGRKARSRVI
jgi:hypothetical protein